MDAACRGNSAREAGIEPIRLALERRPGEEVRGEGQADRALLGSNLRRSLGRKIDVLAGRQSHDLRLARALQIIEADEAFADILADRERTVIAQDHRRLLAKVRNQPLALVEVDGDAFILV